MSSSELVLLRVRVLGPELLLPTRLDHRIAVCFCGLPLPRWALLTEDSARLLHVNRCPECGWRPLWARRPELPAVRPPQREWLEDTLFGDLAESIEQAGG